MRWITDGTVPAKPGLYQVRIGFRDEPWWAYWGGEMWGWAYPNKQWAMIKDWKQAKDASQGKVWREVLPNA